MKPGVRTSEFFTSQGASGALFGLVLTEHDWRVRCAALIAIGLIQIGYTISRGLEKSAAAMEAEEK